MLYKISGLQRFKSIAKQITLILLVWGCAYLVQTLLNLPVASGVLGFFILFILLEMEWLNLENVGQGADILLGELLLFFIPPVVGVIQYQELLMASGWKILLVILLSTALVMFTSAWVVKIFLPQDALE